MSRLRYPAQRLAGDGFVLRPWRREDLAAVHAGMQDPEVPRWTRIPEGNPPTAVRSYFDWLEPRREAEDELMFAIADPATDVFLGAISLLRIEWDAGRAEIGYWMSAGARGRGLASGAVRALARYAFTAIGMRRLELRIDPRNVASVGVAVRAGFELEGVLRSFEVHRGERIDIAVYALLTPDGPPGSGPA